MSLQLMFSKLIPKSLCKGFKCSLIKSNKIIIKWYVTSIYTVMSKWVRAAASSTGALLWKFRQKLFSNSKIPPQLEADS